MSADGSVKMLADVICRQEWEIRRYREALEWIAKQPICGPAATWWDMRDRAREALGITDIRENAR